MCEQVWALQMFNPYGTTVCFTVVCVSVCKHLTNLLDKSPWAGYWYALTIAGYAKLTLSPLCFHLVIR